MHQRLTISLTLMPMHLHIHPVPPCHEHSMRQPLLHTKIITTPAEEEASHGASSSFENNTRRGLPLADTTGKTHAPKHDIFHHADAHASSHSPVPPCHEHSMRQPLPPHQNHLRHLQRRGFTWASSSFETNTRRTRRAKLMHQSMTISLTLDAHALHIHPVPPCHDIQCGQPLPPHKIIYDTCREEASHGPVAVSKQHTTVVCHLQTRRAKLMHQKHDNFTHVDAHASSHSPGSTVSRAFNATTTPSTQINYEPAEEEASHGPVAVSKQHTTDTTGKTHAPKHDNFTHADAHASSHKPGSTVSRAFNADNHSLHTKHLRHLQRKGFTWASSSFRNKHTTDTTGKTHAPKHDNFTHADAHASSHSPGSTVSPAFNATTTPSTPKSFTTPAEEEASHGPVAVSKQHTRAFNATTTPSTPKSFTTPAEEELHMGSSSFETTHDGEPGHPSTISIHEGSSSHHATLKHTPLTGNASSGLPLADTTGKTHAPKHDNFTHADAHASSHSPGSTVSRAFNATTTPSNQNHLRHCRARGFTWAVAVSKQHTTGEQVIKHNLHS
ncbi:hypothetical protein Fcan01_28189 [Folsomia candida]|uniref:Uncharacterized protein n=1 Tax=Folsomia candida TaxID=158441 RepID=A0A226CVI4_FOLCA|nr:hypothetical protein Fcan01_28189 [Folsomia candida]